MPCLSVSQAAGAACRLGLHGSNSMFAAGRHENHQRWGFQSCIMWWRKHPPDIRADPLHQPSPACSPGLLHPSWNSSKPLPALQRALQQLLLLLLPSLNEPEPPQAQQQPQPGLAIKKNIISLLTGLFLTGEKSLLNTSSSIRKEKWCTFLEFVFIINLPVKYRFFREKSIQLFRNHIYNMSTANSFSGPSIYKF